MVAKRTSKMHFAETKAVAEAVRGAGELFQFCPAFGVQQIELFAAMSQPAEADSEQPHFSFHVAMDSKKFLEHRKNVGIQPRGFSEGFGARVGLESGIANCQRERSRGQAGFAQALACFLRKMAEHGRKGFDVAGVFAAGMIV